jgi:hypothetical protein
MPNVRLEEKKQQKKHNQDEGEEVEAEFTSASANKSIHKEPVVSSYVAKAPENQSATSEAVDGP